MRCGKRFARGWSVMVDRIATYQEFKRSVVEADFREFMANRDDLRKAWHCAGSLFNLGDWVYAAHKATIDAKYKFVDDNGRTRPVSRVEEFATALGQTNPDFQLIRGVANSSKHFILKPVPPGRMNPPGMPSHAANTYVTSASYDSAAFDSGTFDAGKVKLQASPDDIEFAWLAQSVLDMWNRLFGSEGW
jgi:hypothetical protein